MAVDPGRHVSREDWAGGVVGRHDYPDATFVRTPLQPSKQGGSGTFLAECSDGLQWWVKPPNHLQGGKVLVAENLVGRLGEMIGAPVCEVAVVRIPAEIAGWEFRPGSRLVEGLGSGSRMVPDALEVRTLGSRDRDDNRKRHAGVFALYDWSWGADDQWLSAESADGALFSHDHGSYLPGGPGWSEASLLASVDDAHPAGHAVVGLDAVEVRRLADQLDKIMRADLAALVSSVPASWPVTDVELEVLGFFLERRASQVADRLRVLAGGLI